jgi:predicted 2-oxoglutarate/Fe(II)-dependent dioxygenase YbiX/peroxiredoxin
VSDVRPAAPPLGYGEPAPWFSCRTATHEAFHLTSLGGQLVVLLFVGSLGDERGRAAYAEVLDQRALFDDRDCMFFAVSVDPEDRTTGRLGHHLPGLRCFWDFDQEVSRRFGVDYASPDGPRIFLLDETLRLTAALPLARTREFLGALRTRVQGHRAAWRSQTAPVLTLPRVFEPDFCRALMAYYEARGGSPSGFMREVGGRTVGHHDPTFKRRRDVTIEDEALRTGVRERLRYRLVPMIERAFGWRPTRLERYLVACYSAEEEGFFRPHRDNTTAATAHRKLAVSINLNDAYEGGDLRFPEFGPATYRPPVGGATVFGCGLLHEATPVTRGRRFACLPFLYDDEAAARRDATRDLIVDAPPIEAQPGIPS